jgi:hypothetical protein
MLDQRSGLPPRLPLRRFGVFPTTNETIADQLFKTKKMLGLRFATRNIALSRVSLYRPAQRQAFRTFSTTPRRLATEVTISSTQQAHGAVPEARRQVKCSQSSLRLACLDQGNGCGHLYLSLPSCALRRSEANQRLIAPTLKGLDFNSTTPPSQYQMFKLVTNRKFVMAVKRVMEELNAAGLKLNSDVRTLWIGSPWLLVRGVHSL